LSRVSVWSPWCCLGLVRMVYIPVFYGGIMSSVVFVLCSLPQGSVHPVCCRRPENPSEYQDETYPLITQLMYFSAMQRIALGQIKVPVQLRLFFASSSFRQPHSVYSPPGPPHPAHITSSQSPPSLSPSSPSLPQPFTPSKKSFHKSFPP